jgi:hypothetical protein
MTGTWAAAAATKRRSCNSRVRGIVRQWRATADEDGHYCFAVAYDGVRGSTQFLAGQRSRSTGALRLLLHNAQSNA